MVCVHVCSFIDNFSLAAYINTRSLKPKYRLSARLADMLHVPSFRPNETSHPSPAVRQGQKDGLRGVSLLRLADGCSPTAMQPVPTAAATQTPRSVSLKHPNSSLLRSPATPALAQLWPSELPRHRGSHTLRSRQGNGSGKPECLPRSAHTLSPGCYQCSCNTHTRSPHPHTSQLPRHTQPTAGALERCDDSTSGRFPGACTPRKRRAGDACSREAAAAIRCGTM